MFSRFHPVWLLVLAALSASVLAKAPEIVNTGYQGANIFALPKHRGMLDESLKKQGIAVCWVELPTESQMLGGLNADSIDLATTNDAPPASARAAQADLVYLAHSPADPKAETIVVLEQLAIHSVADLKGKRVELSKGSGVNYLLVVALEKAGLSHKDITPAYLPPADARVAFQRGAIDAWVIWDPFPAEVEIGAKARQIRNTKELVPHYTFYLASRKFADIYPEVAGQMVDKLGKLNARANSHQDEAAGLLSTSTGLDRAIWLKTLARLSHGVERTIPVVYNEQQALADASTRISLLSVKVDMYGATWSLDKP